MNRITKFELLALAIIVIACAMLFGLVAPAGAQDVITEAEFNACMEGWDRLIDDGNPLTRGQLYVLRYRYCVGIDDSSVSDEAPVAEVVSKEVIESADMQIVCMTKDTGGIFLPDELSLEAATVVQFSGEPILVRAGQNNDGFLVIRSPLPFPKGTIIEIQNERFMMDPDWSDPEGSKGCYREYSAA